MGKRLFLSLIVILIALATASATGNTVTIDGIKYYYEYSVSVGNGGGKITARVLVQDGKSKVGEVEIPASITVDNDVKLFVTAIDVGAFDGNKNITKVTIPGCVSKIDGYAFRDCSSLEEVVILTETDFDNVFMGQNFDFKGLRNIYNSAFERCSSLSKINFPESLKYIDTAAFSGCTSLTAIELPDACTGFGISYIFDGCTSLSSVSLPGGISIPINMFSGCASLASVTLRGAVNKIGDNAFKGCTSLKYIDLSKGIKELGSSSFSQSGLESILFPEIGLEKIGQSCFAGSKLKSINIPAGVTFIGGYFCNGCTELTEAVIQGGTYASTEQCQFKNCTKLTRVSLTWNGPLQSYMFLDCSSLASIELSGYITSISSGSFLRCASLESVSLPNTVSSIKREAFKGCSSLESINVPSSVSEIGNEAFYECSKLSEITIPATVTVLPTSAFYKCSSLTRVNLPSTLTSIGNGCFAGCSGLEQFSIPSSLTTLEGYAFNYCSCLKALVFPATTNSIGNSAFANCSSMELVDLRACSQLNITSTDRKGPFKDLPESTVILLPGDYAGSDEIITMDTDENNDKQDYFSADCKPIGDEGVEISKVDNSEGDVEIPATITVKGQEVPVASIAEGAFADNTGLTSVTVPSSITNIGDGAFSGCTNMEYLDLSAADISNFSANAISGLPEKTVVVLPEAMSATDAQTLSAASTNVIYKEGSEYKSANVKLTDGEKFNAPAAVSTITAAAVAYPRPFSSVDVVYSICLPYAQPIPEGIKVYELDEFNDGNLVFTEVTNSMEASKPYLLTSSSSIACLSAANVVMNISVGITNKDVTGYTFCGSLERIPNTEATGYLILQGDKNWHPVGSKEIPANRAYLKPKANAARIIGIQFVDGDGTTSIKTIDLDGTETYYDLQGHRISKPTKAGIYMRDGRKTVVK